MSIATPAFFWSLFAWNIFLQPFTFNRMCLLFRGGSFVDNIYRGLVFVFIQPVCLLVGAFNPFTFKVIIDKHNLVGIYFVVLDLSLYTLFVFPVKRRSFEICWRAGLVELNSLTFCLSVKPLISPSYLNEILAGYSNLSCRLFSFITLSMSCHSLLV